MSYLGTFDGFTAARLGIIAAQSGLNLTGHNISNINTTGYTRQVLEQVAMKTGTSDRYASTYSLHLGTGVLCTGVSQIRDPYLDVRYRNQWSNVGSTDTWLAGLNEVADVLDETGDGDDCFGLLTAQLSDLLTSLEDLKTYSGQESFDTLVRASASAVCNYFNTYANELQTLYENKEDDLNTSVNEVNSILSSIRDLNEQIRKGDIHGDACLEMRDDRNVLIDKLSEYMKIDVIYTEEDLGGGDTVEKLVIRLGNGNPGVTDTENATLIDGVYAVQLEMPENMPMMNENYDPKVVDQTNQAYGMYLKYDEDTDTYVGTNDITEAASAQLKDANGNVVTDGSNNPVNVENSNYNIFLTALADSKDRVMKVHGLEVQPVGELDDNDLYGALQSTRELLTECGEFATADAIAADPNAATKRGIPYYQNCLDLLARQLATVFNEANNGFMVNEDGDYFDSDGEAIQLTTPITYYEDLKGNYLDPTNPLVTGGTEGTDFVKFEITTLNEGMSANAKQAFEESMGMTINEYLKDNGGIPHPDGGNLFSINGDTDLDADKNGNGITAANISVSLSWAEGDTHVVTKYTQLFGGDVDDSTQNKNIQYLVTLFNTALEYNPQDLDPNAVSDHLFSGSFHDMLDNICSVLGNDQRSNAIMLDTYYASAIELDTSRDGVSGVDLNDETVNLMQYEKALTASFRVITVLDEMLDRLINNTAV